MWREESVERRSLKKKRCQKIRMARERDINGKRLKRRRFQETAMTSEKSGEKSASSLGLQSCQQEGLSRFRDVRSKPDQEKVAAPDKDVESRKKCQKKRFREPTQSSAVPARRSGDVDIGSPLSL